MADRRLQVFNTVAKLLSFTKAAETLHMTQPAVTFQVRQLEEHFDTRLFDRTHNRISLTEAGQRVYEYSTRILGTYSEMENAVRELTEEINGVIVIGASTTIAEYMLPALLGDFKAIYPNVSVRLKVSNTDGIVNMVEANIIDLGVVEAPVNEKNLEVEICRHDELVMVVKPDHELAKLSKVSASKMTEYPYICREEGSGTREVILDYLQNYGLSSNDLNIIMELGSQESIKGAIESGMGISILSQATINKELQLGTLVAVPLEPRLERPISFVYKKQKFRRRALEELLKFALSYIEDRKSKMQELARSQAG
jgi:DNA-binding transcriptional LysR family regulator